MTVFKRVAMTNLDKYVAKDSRLSGIKCELNVNGPQFFEGKGGGRACSPIGRDKQKSK